MTFMQHTGNAFTVKARKTGKTKRLESHKAAMGWRIGELVQGWKPTIETEGDEQ